MEHRRVPHQEGLVPRADFPCAQENDAHTHLERDDLPSGLEGQGEPGGKASTYAVHPSTIRKEIFAALQS